MCASFVVSTRIVVDAHGAWRFGYCDVPQVAHYNTVAKAQRPIVTSHCFLHDRPWISRWIKSISNELDITCHVFASQLSGHCDIIANRLWRHQQNVKRASETRGWHAKILVFSVVYGFVVLCKKYSCELFMRSLECYFGDYFPGCCATREINTKITLSWAHKQFATWVHTLFYIYSCISVKNVDAVFTNVARWT